MLKPGTQTRARTAERLEMTLVKRGNQAGFLMVFHWGGKKPFRIVLPGHLAAQAAMQMQEVARKRTQ